MIGGFSILHQRTKGMYTTVKMTCTLEIEEWDRQGRHETVDEERTRDQFLFQSRLDVNPSVIQ